MLFVAGVNGILFFSLLSSVNPAEANFFDLSSIYFTLFLFLFGLVYLICNTIYQKYFGSGSVVKSIQLATRQGVLASLLLVGLLILQSFRILTWYNIFLLVLIMSLAEYFFISRRVRHQ